MLTGKELKHLRIKAQRIKPEKTSIKHIIAVFNLTSKVYKEIEANARPVPFEIAKYMIGLFKGIKTRMYKKDKEIFEKYRKWVKNNKEMPKNKAKTTKKKAEFAEKYGEIDLKIVNKTCENVVVKYSNSKKTLEILPVIRTENGKVAPGFQIFFSEDENPEKRYTTVTLKIRSRVKIKA